MQYHKNSFCSCFATCPLTRKAKDFHSVADVYYKVRSRVRVRVKIRLRFWDLLWDIPHCKRGQRLSLCGKCSPNPSTARARGPPCDLQQLRLPPLTVTQLIILLVTTTTTGSALTQSKVHCQEQSYDRLHFSCYIRTYLSIKSITSGFRVDSVIFWLFFSFVFWTCMHHDYDNSKYQPFVIIVLMSVNQSEGGSFITRPLAIKPNYE